MKDQLNRLTIKRNFRKWQLKAQIGQKNRL